MARLKIGISHLNTVQLAEKGYFVHEKLIENVGTFASPPISMSDFGDALENLWNSYEAAKHDSEYIEERKENEGIVRGMINQLGNYVATVSAGNAAKFVLGGFSPVAPFSPIGPLAPVEHFAVNFKKGYSGSLFLSWRKRKGANSYILQMSTNPVTGFATVNTVSQCRLEVTGLTPGTTYYFRCIPVGALGQGGVSPVESCMAI